LAALRSNAAPVVWEIRTGKVLFPFPKTPWGQGVRDLQFSPDGLHMATAHVEGTIRLWDLAGQKLLHGFPGHKGECSSIAFCPWGKLLVSGGADGQVKIWALAARECLHNLTGHDRYVHCVTWCPDGKRIATTGSDQAIKLWDPRTGTE